MKKQVLFTIFLLSILFLSCNKEGSNTRNNGKVDMQLSNDCNYAWYLDQMDTGIHNTVNCGPTSTIMVTKWFNNKFLETPMDARSRCRPTGGWWFTNDITNYLSEKNVTHGVIELGNSNNTTAERIIKELENGRVIILCVDMYYIRFETNSDLRVDKFYRTNNKGWGHFFVIKGYKVVDGEILFEVYDPNSWGSKYVDGTYKGKDRYYRDEDVFKATNIWWNYAIVVSKKNSVTSAQETKSNDSHYLDMRNVPTQCGR